MPPQYVDKPPGGIEGWREVWDRDLAFPEEPQSALVRFVARLAGPLLRKINRSAAERQRNFNIAQLDMIRDLRSDVATLREELQREAASIRETLQHTADIVARRNDALLSALDQKIENTAARLRDITIEALPTSWTPERRHDFVYRRLEEGLRGSETEVREALEHYASLAVDHQPVIDIGCGRGEFLALCRERGIDARGYDTNERSVADLRARGFDAQLAGVPECLRTIGDSVTGSILASHVVEHIPADDLIELFGQARRILRRGGLLMIETPNAESVMAGSVDFWRDPTHLAPRHVAALTLLGREHGFEVEEVRAVNPYPVPKAGGPADELTDRFFGGQNLRLVLKKV